MSVPKKIIQRIFDYIKNPSMFPLFNFNKLENKGERIDIDLSIDPDLSKLNIFQKIHYSRYSFILDQIETNQINCDIACGTGYGTILLSSKSKEIFGYDIDSFVIEKVRERYSNFKNAKFESLSIMDFNFENTFDNIISFETLEHFTESDINSILIRFNKALKKTGHLYFSVPFKQENDFRMKILGHHKTFNIDEERIKNWLAATNFEIIQLKYQNYRNFDVEEKSSSDDIVICKATKR